MLSKYPLFDSHLHIIDKRFPVISNKGYLPPEFTCKEYLQRMSTYQLCGGVVVSGSFQKFDQSYLIDALKNLGPRFVGVTQLPEFVSDSEIQKLNELGVRAVRFNLKRGGSETIKHLSAMASRIYEISNWHVELYVDSKELSELYTTIINLPSVSIDHLDLNNSGLKLLTQLAEKSVKVKATGFSRVDFNVASALKDIYSANPEALMFGSDLPSTRAPKPYTDNDFILVAETLGKDAALKVFSENAIKFYSPIENRRIYMSDKKNTAIDTIAEEIKRYLTTKPNASETVQGIAKWWLLEQRFNDSIEKVQSAVNLLVKAGILVIFQLSDGTVLYRCKK